MATVRQKLRKEKGGMEEAGGKTAMRNGYWLSCASRQVPLQPLPLIKEQRQRLLLVGISILEFFPRKKSCKRHHGVLHVHDASLLLVNVGGIDDQALQLVQLQ